MSLVAHFWGSWHINMMKNSELVLGRKAMAAISAVEGLTMSNAAQKRQADADRLELTPAERQSAIAKAYIISAK